MVFPCVTLSSFLPLVTHRNSRTIQITTLITKVSPPPYRHHINFPQSLHQIFRSSRVSISPKMTAKSRRTANINVREFQNFFQGWLVRQEHYLEELRSALRSSGDDEDLRDLIARVLAHYQQYYEEKSRIANHDVWLVFSPPWFSSFERSFFWIAGFKPGLAFRIVGASVDDMSQEQSERMEVLRMETKAEEKELENELARIQESVAAPPVVEVARREKLAEYDTAEMEAAVETLRGEMEVVLANADMLRSRTAERLVEILTPIQNVRFLTAVTELQLKIRIWGSQIDDDTQRR